MLIFLNFFFTIEVIIYIALIWLWNNYIYSFLTSVFLDTTNLIMIYFLVHCWIMYIFRNLHLFMWIKLDRRFLSFIVLVWFWCQGFTTLIKKRLVVDFLYSLKMCKVLKVSFFLFSVLWNFIRTFLQTHGDLMVLFLWENFDWILLMFKKLLHFKFFFQQDFTICIFLRIALLNLYF